MAKGDICRIKNCNKIINIKESSVCGMHNSRWKRHRSYDLPYKKIKSEFCAINGCEKKRAGKKYCSKHLDRYRRYGSYELPNQAIIPEGYIKICCNCGPLKLEEVYIPPKSNEKRCRTCIKKNSDSKRYVILSSEISQRKCSRCKVIKIKTEFRNHDWKLRSPYCHECRTKCSTSAYDKNKSHLKRTYNLTMEEYNSILTQQNYVCAICKSPENASSGSKVRNKIRTLAVDHCHETNANRGLLCGACNRAIGLLKENLNSLQSAIEYLQYHKQ